ncbi:hypothetical protein RHMOL_Rhmol08G0276400 [Rhododendron molle]|uniref:Uncharacterized protein n=1 Tax=Rhododendron molle TaxID=49168 RepID=A0ACC0MUJ5_RHOML|nr:hypothetical protein RHMOL_Rhmol08G0276400 [Rhododendron molle]
MPTWCHQPTINRIGRCCQLRECLAGWQRCRAADPTFFSAIDDSDLDQAMDGSKLYEPKFNVSLPCRDQRLDAARQPTWQGVFGNIPVTLELDIWETLLFFFFCLVSHFDREVASQPAKYSLGLRVRAVFIFMIVTVQFIERIENINRVRDHKNWTTVNTCLK